MLVGGGAAAAAVTEARNEFMALFVKNTNCRNIKTRMRITTGKRISFDRQIK